MKQKRHGFHAVENGGKIYVTAGAGNAGCCPELNDIEVMTC